MQKTFDENYIKHLMTIDVPNSRGDATNYTCCLIRLIAKADPSNRHKLSTVYPNEVEAYARWEAKAMRYIDPNLPKIGTIVIAGANNHCVEEGMKGIVYEHYDRTHFDNEAEDNTGLGLLFENGFYDGFSQHDLKTFQINITDESIPELEDYVFMNVTRLLEDFYRGKFKPAFHREKSVNESELNDYFFTFGSNQPNFPGHVKIRAMDESTARKLMVEKYETRWSMCYPSFSNIHPDDQKQVDIIVQQFV